MERGGGSFRRLGSMQFGGSGTRPHVDTLKLNTTYYDIITMSSVDSLYKLADVYQGLARSGRGAGARLGEWKLRIVESGDVRDNGLLDLEGLGEIEVAPSVRTERHLLRPFDVLVTARTGSVQTVLVPPGVSRTVAGVTLLVVRPRQPESGMGHWLWYFLTSAQGRAQLARRMTSSATIMSLSARSLSEVEVPVPSPRQLDMIVRLVEASETAYAATVEAMRLRRQTLRDAIIEDVSRESQRAIRRRDRCR